MHDRVDTEGARTELTRPSRFSGDGMTMDRMLLGSILQRNARDPGLKRKPAVIFGDRALTYGELNAQSNRIANGLLDLGVRKGDRIGVLSRNSDVYVAVYFALAKAGAIMVPVNFWYRSREIRYTLQQSGARGLIYQTRFVNEVGGIGVLAGLEWMLTIGGAHGNRLEDVAAGSRSDEPAVELNENDPHIILYTSGTTGFPKGAVFSHKSHYLQALALAQSTGGRSDDVGLVVYPLFHTGGPDCLVLPHFLTGATLVILDGADPGEILSAVALHGATNVFCVPTVWRWILARQRLKRHDVSSVRRCLGSSDTFPAALLEDILETFESDVYVTYGLTEAGCILTVCPLTSGDLGKLGSVGRPMASVELDVVDSSGSPVAPGEAGEVVAKTASAMLEYWNMPEKTREALKGGWLHTGDLGRMDEDGYLYLSGRAKDLIISGGENIYPLEIERLLKEHPKIRDAAVVGVPDREWGESVLAAVVAGDGADLTPGEVSDYARARLAGFKKPRWVEIIPELPVTTATGKVRKAVLRDRYRDKYGTA